MAGLVRVWPLPPPPGRRVMPLTDLTYDELLTYAPDVPAPDDLAEFWSATLTEARTHDLAVTTDRADSALTAVDTYDLTFAGFAGDPVRAWLHVPAGATGPLPCVVQYIGYG